MVCQPSCALVARDSKMKQAGRFTDLTGGCGCLSSASAVPRWTCVDLPHICKSGIVTICQPRNMKTFRIIRLTRLLKTVQFVKIFRFVMALRMLVTSIMSTLKAGLSADRMSYCG